MSLPKDRRLLLFNLRTDVDDHILGFTSNWVRALAEYYPAIDVLTMHRGRVDLPEHVHIVSAGREQGYSEVRRLGIFYAHLGRLLVQHRYSACFAHMMPLFAALGGPLLIARGVPLTTWYTHRSVTRQLRLALRFSRRVVTAVPTSFPLLSPKVRALGHGIDTEFYAPLAQPLVRASSRPRIVCVARLTEIKNQHILLEALRDLAADVVLIGDIPDGFDDAYKVRLQAQVEADQLGDRVIFAGAQTPEQVRNWYAQADLAVNLSPVGLFDKAPLESMACGVPTLVTNPAFAPVMGQHADHLILPDASPEALVDRLRILMALPDLLRTLMAANLRQAVIDQHSLATLIQRLVAVLETGEIVQGSLAAGDSEVK